GTVSSKRHRVAVGRVSGGGGGSRGARALRAQGSGAGCPDPLGARTGTPRNGQFAPPGKATPRLFQSVDGHFGAAANRRDGTMFGVRAPHAGPRSGPAGGGRGGRVGRARRQGVSS